MVPDAGQVTDGDITIDSNHETADQIAIAFQDDPPPPSEDTPAVEPVEAAEGGDAPAPAPAKKRTRRNDPTEAVKSAIAKQREAERRADAAESRVQELSAPAPTLDPQPAPESEPQPPSWSRFKQMPGVPTVDQFQSYEDYSMALAEFVADAKHTENTAAQRQAYEQQQIAQEQRVQLDRWSKTLDEARQQNPQFDETLNLDTPMSLPMQHLAMESPQGIAILQWLSEHPDDAQRLSTLHPAETYREMGKLEARLEAASPTGKSGPARVVSSAKAPIKPLGTSPPSEDPFEITDDLSMDEHFRRMNAADRQSGRL
jgi:chemotaxis protein histidine kinase CheA